MSLLLSGTDGLSDVDGTAATPAIRGTDANTGIFFPAADTIAFSEGGVESMRIDASGNLGIGIAPSAWGADYEVIQNASGFFGNYQTSTLLLGQNWYDSGAGSYTYKNTGFASYYRQNLGGHIWHTAPSGTAGNAITFTQAMTLDASGNLLVGTTSNPGFKFYVNGTVSATGSVSFPQSNNDTTANAANMNIQGDGFLRRSTSALKYKQDVRDLESIDVNLFRPVRYKSKCVSDDQTKDHIGIVADEVAAAGIEELVNRGADGEVEGFQYERLNVILLKAIQEQQATISAMETRLAALEA
jgi:hypothetical protein